MGKGEKNISKILFILLLASILLRLVYFTKSPPGIFLDEASFGYNAFSIAQTGHDEHGFFMPVYFQAFGDYKNPVQVYAMVPIIKIFGLSVFTVRFTSALFGIGSILLFIYLLYLTTKNKNFSMLGGLILSVMPWHFIFSRIGFEAMSYVFFIILAMVLFAKFIYTKSDWYFLAFCLSLSSVFSPIQRLD